jgi:hypothetical protein
MPVKTPRRDKAAAQKAGARALEYSSDTETEIVFMKPSPRGLELEQRLLARLQQAGTPPTNNLGVPTGSQLATAPSGPTTACTAPPPSWYDDLHPLSRIAAHYLWCGFAQTAGRATRQRGTVASTSVGSAVSPMGTLHYKLAKHRRYRQNRSG